MTQRAGGQGWGEEGRSRGIENSFLNLRSGAPRAALVKISRESRDIPSRGETRKAPPLDPARGCHGANLISPGLDIR